MKLWWKAMLTVAIIAAAAMLWHNLPANTEIYAPFDVSADAGAPAATSARGRNIAATVTGIYIAPELRPENAVPPRLDATGEWVVVDATITAIQAPGLVRVQLLVGPDTYVQTDRLSPTARLGGLMQPEIVHRGAWVFDVAPEALAAVDTVVLQVWLGDGRLDSGLSVGIPLGDASRVASLDLPRPVVSAA